MFLSTVRIQTAKLSAFMAQEESYNRLTNQVEMQSSSVFQCNRQLMDWIVHWCQHEPLQMVINDRIPHACSGSCCSVRVS